MPILFLDTNVFLHYQQFDQIDWVKLMNSGAVEIIIPPVTLRELNKNKELHKLSHIRERAQKSLELLDNFFEPNKDVQIRDNLFVRFEDREPNINFELNQLDTIIQDDHLIASILMFRNENPDNTIILVTSDIGLGLLLRAKAGRQNIQTYKLEEKFKLQEHTDPAQKKIEELKNEIQNYKNKVPKILLLFKNGEKHNKFVLQEPLKKTSDEYQNALNEIKSSFPKREKFGENSRVEEGENTDNIDLQLLKKYSAINGISQSEYDRYNNELEEFYKNFSDYLYHELEYANLRRRTIRLDIMLSNNGNTPANDIDIVMHFPDGFRLVEEDELPKPPKKPNPPIEPRSLIDMMTTSLQPTSLFYDIPGLKDIGPVGTPTNVSSFDIKKTNSYSVKLHVNIVKHNMNEYFEPLYLIFNSFEDANSFKIEYELFAANIPSPISDFLHVVLKKEIDEETNR